MHRRHLFHGFAAAALAVLTLSPARAEVMGDGSTIRLLTSPAGTQSFPPFVIERFGLDEKYGFTLEVVPSGNTTATINGLMAGAAEMAALDWVQTARLRNNGVPVIGVVPFLAYVNTIIVPADSPVTTVADLAGKRIGALNVRSFDWIMTLAAADAHGVNLLQGSEVIEGAPSLMRGMLEQGQVDATLMWNSLTPDTVADGRFRVMSTVRELALGMGLPDAPMLMYVANTDWAAENPQNVAAFVAAYREAVEILLTDDQIWLDRGVGEMGMTPEAAAVFRDLVRADLLTAFDGSENDTFRATFDLLYQIAGDEVFGFSEMPETIITMDFN